MTPTDWRKLLTRFSRELLQADNLDVPPPAVARKSGWMGYRPASERAITEAERRLGTTLPPSLKTFYRVTNGWRAIGYSISTSGPCRSSSGSAPPTPTFMGSRAKRSPLHPVSRPICVHITSSKARA
jgi:hypothetical protein